MDTYHHPSCSEKYDNAKNVQHTRCKNTCGQDEQGLKVLFNIYNQNGSSVEGLKKELSSLPGQVDIPAGQATFIFKQVICQLK